MDAAIIQLEQVEFHANVAVKELFYAVALKFIKVQVQMKCKK